MSLFKITIQDKDRTSSIQGRLLDLTLTDKRGLEADELSITLDDHDAALPLPSKGDKIQLWLATTAGKLIDKGSYTIDEAEHSGTPDQMSIKAKSADMKSKLKVKRSESHHATTLGAMAAKIAKRHNLKLAIHKDASSIEIAHLDQTSESDMNLLTRLAQEHDLMASVKHGRLLITPAGTGITASGKSLSTVIITRQSGDQHRYGRADRDSDYDCASSSYHDKATGKTKTVSFWSSLKNELIHQTHYDYRERAKGEIVEYIEIFYNRVRRHTKLGNISPAEAFNNFMRKAA